MTERLKSSQEGRARLMYLMYLSIHEKANKIVAAYIVIVIVQKVSDEYGWREKDNK